MVDTLVGQNVPLGNDCKIASLRFTKLYHTSERLSIPGLYDLAHVARWESYALHDVGYVFLGWICTIRTLHNIS